MRRVVNTNRLVAIFILFILLLLTVNAAFAQLSLFLTGQAKNINSLLLSGLLLTVILAIYTRKRITSLLSIQIPSYIYLVCTLAPIFYYLQYNTLSYITSGYQSTILCAMLFIFTSTNGILSDSTLYRILKYVIIALSLLGLAQYIFSSPILPTSDGNGWKIGSFMYLDFYPPKVRGFSLFYSALDFGYLLIFAIGMAISKKDKLFLLIIIAAVFTTLTRNIYIGALISAMGAAAFNLKAVNSKQLLILPAITFIFSFLVSGVSGAQQGLSSSRTLLERREFWNGEMKNINDADLFPLLIGRGVYQSGDAKNSQLFVDNTYLHFMAQFGFVGLIAFLILFIALLYFSICDRKSPLRSAMYSFLCAWPFMAMFNICIQPVFLFAFLTLVAKREHKAVQENLK